MAYLDSHGLQTLWGKIKSHFGKTLEVDKSATAVDIKLKNASSTPDVLSTITLPAAGTNSQAGVMTATQAAKLDGISEGAEANVQADWAQTVTTADDYIKNKPSLATVATSGSYTDLSNKPTIDSSISSTSTNAVQNKVISIALGGKVDKVSGKGLSTNDYTTTEKNKLSGIAAGAEVNVQPDWDETDSTSDAYIKNKPAIPDGAVIYHNLGQNTDGAIDQKVVTNELNAKEVASNKVTSWSSTTTDTNYPSEKLVKDSLDDKVPVTRTINSLPLSEDILLTASNINGGIPSGSEPAPSGTIAESLKTLDTTKVSKVSGKGLSTNDYTTTEKNKLAGIEANANNYVHPTTSGNKHIPSGGFPGDILGWVADGTVAWIDAPATGVTKITAGSNVTISPTGGTGDVTINATDTTYVFNTAYNASTNKAATMSDINSAVAGNAKYKGTLASEAALTGLTNYKQGNYWVISSSWTSSSMGITLDAGNMIFANADGSTFAKAKFDVIQADIEAIPDSEINALN